MPKIDAAAADLLEILAETYPAHFEKVAVRKGYSHGPEHVSRFYLCDKQEESGWRIVKSIRSGSIVLIGERNEEGLARVRVVMDSGATACIDRPERLAEFALMMFRSRIDSLGQFEDGWAEMICRGCDHGPCCTKVLLEEMDDIPCAREGAEDSWRYSDLCEWEILPSGEAR